MYVAACSATWHAVSKVIFFVFLTFIWTEIVLEKVKCVNKRRNISHNMLKLFFILYSPINK